MGTFLTWVMVIAGIHLLRKFVSARITTARNHEDFSGTLFQIDRSVVAYQPQEGKADADQNIDQSADRSIICMHGWLEDHRYFTGTYTPEDGELILINSCDYHVPVLNQTPKVEAWSNIIGYPARTIEYDAAVLIRAVENLATSDNLRLHGHSRGGAVVLEALKQRPELFKNAEVILEAPILPEATIITRRVKNEKINKLIVRALSYPFPFIAALLNKYGLPEKAKSRMGRGPIRKRLIVDGLFNSPKQVDVLVDNIRNMQDWPLRNSVDLFDLANRGTFLIPAWDNVLSKKRMLASANRNKGNMAVIETKDTSHFVTIDNPTLIPGFSS